MNSHTKAKFDVLIVGAGPAGATAALNLAPIYSVALVDSNSQPSARIAESLAPAARRLFADMEIWESFQAQHMPPCHANWAVWGGATPSEMDFLRDPDGHGWHIDRMQFDSWLRSIAVARGAQLIAPARLKFLECHAEGWRASLDTPAGSSQLLARFVIDAGGRTSIAHHLGARRHIDDRLVCGWVYGNCSRPSLGITYIEAVEDGWWYTAPLQRGRVVAFHTDADLPAAGIARHSSSLPDHIRPNTELAATLSECGFEPLPQSGFTAANSSFLRPCAGQSWLAIGDAALSFDPLSSQGLLNALFTGLAGAEAADRSLSGDARALDGYTQIRQQIHGAYRRHLTQSYRAETRWPASPFWRRRQATSSV